ncbi:MAG: S8 family serine peptidase, partial [Phycisphaerae bacterium]|nr:S8 family serine peptidase [Phycisphaerae bacterium]
MSYQARTVRATTATGFNIAVAGALLGVLLSAAPGQAAEIPWRSGAFDVPTRTPAEIATVLEAFAARDGAARHVVVQFDGPVDDDTRAMLAAEGLELLAYVGANSYFAAVTPGRIDAGALSATRALLGVEAIQPAWKLHPLLSTGRAPAWAIVTADSDPIVGAYVVFHADVSLATGIARAEELGATVRDALDTVNALVIELPQSAIAQLVADDTVQWVEPPLPRMSELNDSNRARVQADLVQAAPYNLTGAGVNVLVYDGGTARSTHVDFEGRLSVRDSSGMASHSTHVAGTIGGAGVANATYKGMAPDVTIQSYGFEYDGSGIFLYSNPGDIQSDYNQAINTYGAVLANNSIGTNTETNGFDCAIQGNYGVTDQLIDNIVRGSLGAPFRILWAAGNERQGSRCDVEGYGDYYSSAPPAGAKNHICVGAVNSDDDSMTSFSSWGPTDDGRMKPDICGPGCQNTGDGGVTSCNSSSNTAYTTMCGTSMACPTVTGCAALIVQDFRAQFPGQPLFRNSTLKAWLAHTAVDLGTAGPDYQFGYGSVRVKDAIDFMRTGAFVESTLSQGGSYSRTVTVSAGDPELRVTLAWDDYPGTPNVNPALVNDLDLRVYGPGGTRYYPWTLSPTTPSAAAVRTQENHRDNLEQVLVSSPAAGTWTIEVYGYAVPQGPQSFSLVGDGAMNVGTSISLPNGAPQTMPPGVAQVIDVQIVSIGETTVPGSPTLYYRYDGDTYQTAALTLVGGNLYQATLPAASCADNPEYYFSAAGSSTGIVYYPAGAPTTVLTAIVGETTTIIADSFETDLGWTATNLGATAGNWQRGVPVNDPSWDYDPAADSDGSGKCWLTQNETGNTDVDNGSVRLTSPVIDMSGGNITISYDYFLRLTNTTGAVDRLLVEINNGGSTWIEIARHTTNNGLNWTHHEIGQAALTAAGVTLTSTMQLRFTANDADPQSVVEAGLDAFRVDGFQCESGDTTPPTPDPMTFAVAPAPSSTTAIAMTATTATDTQSPPVQYFFDFVSGGAGGSDSAWQSATAYTDSGLAANTSYTYRVKARDSAATPNEGTYSSNAETATLIETPTGVTFETVTDSSIVLTATGTLTNLAVDTSGVYFDSTTTGGDGGINAWIQTTTDTATGLSPNTAYTFRVKARNQNSIETAYSTTASKVTLASVPAAPTLSNPTQTSMVLDVIAGGNPASTQFAIQCTATTDAAWNGKYVSAAGQPVSAAVWQTDSIWGTMTVLSMQPATAYSFAVKARNADNVETALGPVATLSTLAIPTGACCFHDGSCQQLSEAACTAAGGEAWTMDQSCTPNPCTQPIGACCFHDGSCQQVTEAACTAAGGEAWMMDVACEPNPCTQPTGACCFHDGSCQQLTEAACTAAGGEAWMMDVACEPNPCTQPTGACCFHDGTCQQLTEAACTAAGGEAWTMDQSCTPSPCAQPTGACCFHDGTCQQLTEAACTAAGGEAWTMDQSCTPSPCAQPTGACCFHDATCQQLTEAACTAAGGEAWTMDQSCTPNPCAQPVGACCFHDGSCQQLTEAACTAAGGEAW